MTICRLPCCTKEQISTGSSCRSKCRFMCNSSRVNCVNLPSSEGMKPVKKLVFNTNSCRATVPLLVVPPSSEGIEPESRLLWASNCFKCPTNNPISLGRCPDSRLSCTQIPFACARDPNCVGKDPVSQLSRTSNVSKCFHSENQRTGNKEPFR